MGFDDPHLRLQNYDRDHHPAAGANCPPVALNPADPPAPCLSDPYEISPCPRQGTMPKSCCFVASHCNRYKTPGKQAKSQDSHFNHSFKKWVRPEGTFTVAARNPSHSYTQRSGLGCGWAPADLAESTDLAAPASPQPSQRCNFTGTRLVSFTIWSVSLAGSYAGSWWVPVSGFPTLRRNIRTGPLPF